ncbi:MAG TPA: Pycsar system effector family protein [Longimicrobium sp.]|jgi:hypothetical protein|uniref:Pycsar system effector family protein n=1 Tax=Longimicrobium sp. TaxID=2029185 RepID=UPI002ED9C0B4
MDKHALLETMLSRQLQWIAAADLKVSPLATVDIAMFGVLAAVAPGPKVWTGVSITLTVLALATLSASLLHLLVATSPRTRDPVGSLIYFGGITQRTEEEFVVEMQNLKADQYELDLARQTYRNACIAGEKYKHVKTGTRFLYAAIIPWTLAVYLLISLNTQ